MSLYPVKKLEFDICPDGCYLYISDDITSCPNKKCGKQRYRNGQQNIEKKAYATMQYLPLTEQLGAHIAHKTARQLLNYPATLNYQKTVFKDIFDGQAIRGMKQWDSDTIALALFQDGFRPFIHSKASMTIVMLVILNLPPEER